MHLVSALNLAARQRIAMRWEVSCIGKALARPRVPVVLLKGAAYLMAELPAAAGRMFGDVDILVPKESLGDVESALMIHGWRGSNQSDYDQRYYRKWMHEIPPMYHVRRGTCIDVHHSILPETARIKVDTNTLFGSVVPVADHPKVYALMPADMLLHSATHLFHEGELENGLRDLFDLDSLFRHFGNAPRFWDDLVPRAIALGLTRPLYYAVRYTTMILATPIPPAVVAASQHGRPPPSIVKVMDWSYERVFRPFHSSCRMRGTQFARTILYCRSHWIRMPFFLLLAHLARKAFLRPKAPDIEDAVLTDREQ